MKSKLFNINIENYLHSIDASFKDKSKKDIYMTYIMVFGVIFAFSYLLFWDSSFNSFEKTRKNVIALKDKIQADEIYLQINPQTKIQQLDNEINKLTLNLDDIKNKNSYIKERIETIPFLIYDERTWGEYIDSISTNAQTYHIKINDIINKYSKSSNLFGHILDIHVEAEGSYKNMMGFINKLEQNDLVVDIHNLNIKADKKLISDMNISVWGITY
jgi:Tfp pilus assembly protein PilO